MIRKFFNEPILHILGEMLRWASILKSAKLPKLFGFVGLMLFSAYVSAQPDRPMSFSVFRPCSGNADFCAPRVLAEGVIERDSHRKLSVFLSNSKSHPNELPPLPAICFNSPGGDLAGAIELGRLIRKLGFNTCLAPSYSRVPINRMADEDVFANRVICSSACAFAIVGGTKRLIEKQAKLGVHQFFGKIGPIGDANTQLTVVALAAYLEEMGVNRELLDISSLTPVHDMYWLNEAEMRKLRIDNLTVEMSKWRLEALNDGTVVTMISQTKPGPESQVTLVIFKHQGQPLLLVIFSPGNRQPSSLTDALAALNSEEINLRIDDRAVALFSSVSWRTRGDSLVARLPLSPSAIASMRSGRLLQLRVSVIHALGQYDPSLDFPLSKIGPMLTAALK